MPAVTPVEHVLLAMTPLNLLWEGLGLALLAPILWRAFVVRPDTSPDAQDGTAPVAPPYLGK